MWSLSICMLMKISQNCLQERCSSCPPHVATLPKYSKCRTTGCSSAYRHLQPYSHTAIQPYSHTGTYSHTAIQPYSHTGTYSHTAIQTPTATPMVSPKGSMENCTHCKGWNKPDKTFYYQARNQY